MFRWKFQHQLALLFTIGVFCFVVMGTLIAGWLQIQKHQENLIDHGHQITASFAQKSALALLVGIGENAANEAETTLGFPDVVYVAIYDKNENALLSRGDLTLGKVDKHQNMESDSKVIHENDKYVHFAMASYLNDSDSVESPFELSVEKKEYLGHVHVVMSKQKLQAIQYSAMIENLIGGLVLGLVLILLLLKLIQHLVRPLTQLADMMKRAQQGESNVRADLKNVPQEVFNMANIFNTMMAVLEERSTALDQQNEQLKSEIKEREIAEKNNAKLQQQLSQVHKMEALGQLTGGVAHDFNNILASMLGFTELAKDLTESRDRLNTQAGQEKMLDYLDEIYMSGDRAQNLVKQMLTFSRSGNNEKLLLVDIVGHVSEAVKMLRPVIPTSIDIDIISDASRYMVMANPVQLHQLLMNICINARDAMKGRGKIRIAVNEVSLTHLICTSCRADLDGRMIELAISDTGIGINEEILSRVFEPFFTTKGVGEGTGMGLSMVHGIIHHNNGHVVVESKPNEGAAFRLFFPLPNENTGVNSEEPGEGNNALASTGSG